ncbi:MAG TPA: NUDIX domain-containing protein [Gemmatimonadaceae bacterium]|nr:NUDIX domain-containing protein [Gemmatimonadaceae bacterium]
MYHYVLALLFTADREQIVLVEKTRPAWQAGRVNALGGKLEPGERAEDAARREVREEAGVEVADWHPVLVWHDAQYTMHVVRAFDDAALHAHTAEDQRVFRVPVTELPPNVIDNVRWLVPLALDREVALPIEVRSASPTGSGLTEPPPE